MTDVDTDGNEAVSGTAEPTRPECDMIMKGGITSGVVYPLAASHLAETYTFRNLGGASAGAIAATIVAAAELGRQRGGSGGFEHLDRLPAELGSELGNLFQPSPATAPAYRLLITAIDRDRSKFAKVVALLSAAIRSAWIAFLITLVIAMVPGVALAVAVDAARPGRIDVGDVAVTALLWLPLALLIAVAVAVYRFAMRTKRSIERNGFGVCDGHTQTLQGHPPLTDWLSAKINAAAGAATAGPPVTFGDLWGTESVRRFDEKVPDGTSFLDLLPYERSALAATRTIALEVMTTNLTLRRPYRFPFESREFLFCERCMAKYFPAPVVRQMTDHSAEADDKPRPAIASGAPNATILMRCPLHPDVRVRYLPRPADMPVVVAARLSLSFPALICAVPLCYVDYARAPEYVELINVWFSDGGIASNFPMHLFDAMWPGRPTFGINLQPLDAEHGPARAYLPRSGQPRSHPIGSLVAFGQALLDTMQNWADVTQLTLPAYHGRVAEVRLAGDEGGMNLHMPPPLITTISALGAQAAELFDDFDLPHHQNARFAASMAAVDAMLAGMRAADRAGFDAVVAASAPVYRRAAAEALVGLADTWADDPAHPHPATTPNVPHPVADLRMVPRQ